jgi:poly(U)-specific endoribonuclease
MIQLGETLYELDNNKVGNLIELNYGCTTNNGNSNDCSPDNLFVSVDPSIKDIPIYQKLAALYDNYNRDVNVVEDNTQQEQDEESEFLQAVMDSEVMMATYEFLLDNPVFNGDYTAFEEKVRTLWFHMYERANGKLSSSGFEHVFIGEVKNGDLGGFHNWFRWYTEEAAGKMNYLGHWRTATIGQNEGYGLEFTYIWDGVQKPYGSMMIGTSPGLELSLYTACLLTFPDKYCHVSLAGTDV